MDAITTSAPRGAQHAELSVPACPRTPGAPSPSAAGPARPASTRAPKRNQTTVQAERKTGTQRQRLLAAAVQVAAEHGYEATTIARIITTAGVSRPTFYEQFPSREDCLLRALTGIERQLLEGARRAIEREPGQRAAGAVIGVLVSLAEEQPAAARMLMGETLAGGPRILDARDHGVAEIARLIEQAYEHVGPTILVPDISPPILVGAVQRLIASCLRRGPHPPATFEQQLTRWLESYSSPLGEHRWRSLTPHAPPSRSPLLPASPLQAPPPLPPGRPRQPRAVVAEIHRQRILFAAAEALHSEGYAAMSVAQITRRAGVDGRVFYSLFTDRQDVLRAVSELTFQHTMAVTAGAFFTPGSWPERVWEAGRALTQYLEQNATITGASLLDSYAGGAGAVQRVEELTRAFTLFLQEGYEQAEAQSAEGPSALALEAVAAAAFEVGYQQARAGRLQRLSGLLGHLAHLCLAPFLGSTAANEQIDRLSGDGGGSDEGQALLRGPSPSE